MKTESLKRRVRELAHLLACEEESDCRLKDWYDRRSEHNKLLAKLYRIEKKI